MLYQLTVVNQSTHLCRDLHCLDSVAPLLEALDDLVVPPHGCAVLLACRESGGLTFFSALDPEDVSHGSRTIEVRRLTVLG